MQPRLLKHPARLAGASLLRLQDDQRLVALAREGHDPAFAAIVDRYGRALERYCARLLGPGRAEDAVQQAFVNAHAAMRATDQELALKPWLYRIAHNAALNILRAARDEDEALDMERPGAVQTAEVVELRERLRETLASIQALPPAQRDALLLRELEGRSHEEIAAALGVSEGGARQHLHRARVSLRAAASAITPYPILARVLSAAAAEGGSGGADIVSGAGLGAGAGAIKIAAGVLAAGAIAGGAVGVNQHSTPRPTASHSRPTTALESAANGPSATPLEVADDRSAGAMSHRGRGARGQREDRRDGRRRGSSHRGPSRSGDDHSGEHHASDDGSGKSGSGSSGSGGSDHSGSGSSGSGGSGSSGPGSDDTTTAASTDATTTTTTDGVSSGSGSSGSGSSGSGSDDGLSSGSGSGSSGSDAGATLTTTASTDGHDGGGGSTTTGDH